MSLVRVYLWRKMQKSLSRARSNNTWIRHATLRRLILLLTSPPTPPCSVPFPLLFHSYLPPLPALPAQPPLPFLPRILVALCIYTRAAFLSFSFLHYSHEAIGLCQNNDEENETKKKPSLSIFLEIRFLFAFFSRFIFKMYFFSLGKIIEHNFFLVKCSNFIPINGVKESFFFYDIFLEIRFFIGRRNKLNFEFFLWREKKGIKIARSLVSTHTRRHSHSNLMGTTMKPWPKLSVRARKKNKYLSRWKKKIKNLNDDFDWKRIWWNYWGKWKGKKSWHASVTHSFVHRRKEFFSLLLFILPPASSLRLLSP